MIQDSAHSSLGDDEIWPCPGCAPWLPHRERCSHCRLQPLAAWDLRQSNSNSEWFQQFGLPSSSVQRIVPSFNFPDCALKERELMQSFHLEPKSVSLVNDHNRHMVSKTSFNYMMIDPRVCGDLVSQACTTAPEELFRRFINSIFYVGKGSDNRPNKHLWSAAHAKNNGARNEKMKLSNQEKYHVIWDIWKEGRGPIMFQAFQGQVAVEAFTREASMIEALLVCGNLKNISPGDWYGSSRNWSKNERIKMGMYFLLKIFAMFLTDGGQRETRRCDLKIPINNIDQN